MTRSSHTLYRAVFAANWSIGLEFVCHWKCTNKVSKGRTNIWISIVLNGHGRYIFFKVISFAVVWSVAVLEFQKDSAINNLFYGQFLCEIKMRRPTLTWNFKSENHSSKLYTKLYFAVLLKMTNRMLFEQQIFWTLKLFGYFWSGFRFQILILFGLSFRFL